jgi:hypothetical protein
VAVGEGCSAQDADERIATRLPRRLDDSSSNDCLEVGAQQHVTANGAFNLKLDKDSARYRIGADGENALFGAQRFFQGIRDAALADQAIDLPAFTAGNRRSEA